MDAGMVQPENITAHISVCEQGQGRASLLKACPEDNVDDHEDDRARSCGLATFFLLERPHRMREAATRDEHSPVSRNGHPARSG